MTRIWCRNGEVGPYPNNRLELLTVVVEVYADVFRLYHYEFARIKPYCLLYRLYLGILSTSKVEKEHPRARHNNADMLQRVICSVIETLQCYRDTVVSSRHCSVIKTLWTSALTLAALCDLLRSRHPIRIVSTSCRARHASSVVVMR